MYKHAIQILKWELAKVEQAYHECTRLAEQTGCGGFPFDRWKCEMEGLRLGISTLEALELEG